MSLDESSVSLPRWAIVELLARTEECVAAIPPCGAGKQFTVSAAIAIAQRALDQPGCQHKALAFALRRLETGDDLDRATARGARRLAGQMETVE